MLTENIKNDAVHDLGAVFNASGEETRNIKKIVVAVLSS
jgi:hypothetical protein